MPGLATYPPFPDDIPSHPLVIVDYELVKANDREECEKLWKAATELGFWYLKNYGANQEVEAMFNMGAETMQLPLQEKVKYEQGDEGASFGYKAAGTNAVDRHGNLDSTEFLNVAKDDALRWPLHVHRTYPSSVNKRMEDAIRPFVLKSLEINGTLLDLFNNRLELPEGTLSKLHNPAEMSGCSARFISAPPQPNVPPDKLLLSAHTDFGSLSLLYNRLGGLQVLPPGSDKWYYIKPLPGHAICNLGDAMYFFSGGILKSNIHRVVPPPENQADYKRESVVFFTRPADTVRLRALVDESAVIAYAVNEAQGQQFDPGCTAKEWLARRIKLQRIKNYKGPEAWIAGRGTENQNKIAAADSE